MVSHATTLPPRFSVLTPPLGIPAPRLPAAPRSSACAGARDARSCETSGNFRKTALKICWPRKKCHELWISMDMYGNLWIPMDMDIYGLSMFKLWIIFGLWKWRIHLLRFIPQWLHELWISMDIYGCWWYVKSQLQPVLKRGKLGSPLEMGVSIGKLSINSVSFIGMFDYRMVD